MTVEHSRFGLSKMTHGIDPVGSLGLDTESVVYVDT